jgi:hypothetical protein
MGKIRQQRIAPIVERGAATMTEQQPHADRAHMEWAASSGAANMKCAGRIAMETISPEEKESEYAAWGTSAHEVSDICLRSG